MQSILQRAVLAILLSLGSLSCVGQTNEYPMPNSDERSFVLDMSWVTGSGRNQFGLLEEVYWTDSAGQVMQPRLLTNSSGQRVLKMAPPAVEHRRTQVLLGPLHFSVPLPKVAVAVIGCVIVLALVFLVLLTWGRSRGRHRTRHGPPLPGAVLAILLSFGSLSCVGQTNEDPMSNSDEGIVVIDMSWVIGSGQNQFGLVGYRYWKDSAGQTTFSCRSRGNEAHFKFEIRNFEFGIKTGDSSRRLLLHQRAG
jgi:hypothetical protein